MFAAHMIATLVAFVYVITVAAPHALSQPLWSNTWPVLVVGSIGAVAAVPLAALSKGSSPQTTQ